MKLKYWRSRIELAQKTGSFTEDDRQRIAHWESCFIGELYGSKVGSVITAQSREYRLGAEASLAVRDNDVIKAKRLLEEVESLPMKDRSLLLNPIPLLPSCCTSGKG